MVEMVGFTPTSEEPKPYPHQEADTMIGDTEAQGPEPFECSEGDWSVERQVPAIHRIYVLGEPHGLEVAFIMDSETSDTFVSPQLYQVVPEDIWPKLFHGGQIIEGTGGKSIRIWGWAAFGLQLRWVSIGRVLMVADIKDEVLLGGDILQRDQEGPIDILNSEKVMIFKS